MGEITQTSVEVDNQTDEIISLLMQANRPDLVEFLMKMKRTYLQTFQSINVTNNWFTNKRK